MGERADIKIDGARLEKALAARNMTPGIATKQLGRQTGYFRKIINRGSITQATIYNIEHILGIPPSEYVLDDSLEGSEQEVAVLDYGKLYQVVYDAVYTAVIKAWMNE